jgi:transposase-like protein
MNSQATIPPGSQPPSSPVPRIPPGHGGIQYNACKNPRCVQFGVPAPAHAAKGVAGPYALSSAGKGYPLLKCNCCGEMPPLKSNKGIHEEIERLGAYLREPDPVFCPNGKPDQNGEICPNHANRVPAGTPGAYAKHGSNGYGSNRSKCKECGKVFLSSSKPAKGQHRTNMNRDVFSMLVNKVVLARIVKMLDISWTVLYGRIEFIHEQCMKFAAHRERKLKDFPIDRLYLAIDAQDYLVNWTERKDKRNVVLKAITAADNATGYVFCNALNFDETADRNAIEADAAANGDNFIAAPRRENARYWLAVDYAESVQETAGRAPVMPASTLAGTIGDAYAEALARDDIEAFDEKTGEEALPSEGMQIHSEYTMIAMFHHLKGMIGNCEKWRFFMDQESGIRSACLSAFAREIKDRKAEAFYVSIEKEQTQEKRRELMDEAKDKFDEVAAANPGLDEDGVKLLMIKEEVARQKSIGAFGDRWVSLPLPSMSEPNKAACWLTEHGDFAKPDGTPDEDHVAWLYNKASLHAVDTFFMKTRRSIQMCERPMHSSGNAGRIWAAYQSYDPSVLKKLLEIFRVYHNFVDLPAYQKGVKKKDRKTPAMRLGLASVPITFQDILYFTG